MRIAFAAAAGLMLALPTAAAAQFDNSIPVKFPTGPAPIAITESSVFFPPNGTVRVCVSFRNVSDKPASAVRVTFEFDDLFGNPLRQGILDRAGSFGPGIAIEGKMSELGGNSDSFKNCIFVQGTNVKPSLEKIDVTDVRFEDGTTWKKGAAFVRAFDSHGNRVAAPVPVGGGAPGAGTADAAVNIGGATASGGSVGPAGPVYGTIAWIPGSRTAFGSVADAATQADADFAAMTKCTALANGAPGCKPVVRMFGSDKKCGAIATDAAKFSTARGPDMSSTIQSVLATLAKEGGTIAGNSIISSLCNTR
ncbi:MAG: hypothetical protein JWO66_185 [Candidatus Eremiobacteraeota bacterium]|nr:hypothetical protein [Candidatus Eremiobacteraeota bacterium]